MQVVFREPYRVTFEAYVVYDDIDCDIAYGTLKIDGIILPALRLCVHRFMPDFAVKIYGEYVLKVKKAPYFLQIPPHRYVTYSDAPDILLLMRPGGGAAVLLCNASGEICGKLRDAAPNIYDEEDAYNLIKKIITVRQQ